ncbi:MAG: dihydroorotase [Motiliproteus sp.]
MKIHIRGGRVIDPANQIDAIQDLYIDNGRVLALGQLSGGFQADKVIAAEGLVVCPGLIDLQASLREPGFTQKGTIKTESAAAAAGGVTSLCCPPDTLPVLDTPAVAQLIQDRAEQAGTTRVLPLGALTKGLEGEQLSNMVSLKEAGCIAFSNARKPIANNLTLMRCMEYAATYDLLIVVQSQDQALTDGGVAHEGRTASKLGLPGIPAAAETLDVARYLVLAEHTGARIHFGQLTTVRAVQMVSAAKERGVKVSADTAIQYLLLNDEYLADFDSAYHVIPPLRDSVDQQGLGKELKNGAIQAICSDHQPQDAAEKEAPFGAAVAGMIGLQTLLPLSLKLVSEGVLSLSEVIAKLTIEPARILGLSQGQLASGADADICIFDPQSEWVLNQESSLSLARNTPFFGQPLLGQVYYTLKAGELVFEKL